MKKGERERIKIAKRNYRQSLKNPNRCESCGEVSPFVGVSHIISVKDCLYDDRFPRELAWSPENMTLECHGSMEGGLSCHLKTESHKAEHMIDQKNLDKKMKIFDRWMPWVSEEINLLK